MNNLKKSLKEIDPLISELVELESIRQKSKLHLNAAISISPKSVSEIQGSVLANIDAEGYIPNYLKEESLEELSNIDKQIELYSLYKDERCNKCCEYANVVESLAQKRLARIYANDLIKEEDIYVNVQVPTGALANYLAYEAFLKMGDTILSLDSNNGGHTTHGSEEHITHRKYNVINFHVDFDKKDINYDEIGQLLLNNQPQLLILGPTSFPLEIKWHKVRELIDSYSPKTIFVADIAHIAGLIAGKAYNSPFGYADVITFVGYKTFGGPRAGVIFTTKKEFSEIIDETIFPKILGSAVMLNVAAIAVSASIALTEDFQNLQKKIVDNSRTLCEELLKLNVPIVYETSDCHIVLIDVNLYGSSKEITNYFEDCGIMINDCIVPFANGNHEGIRLGTTWVTELGADSKEIKEIAQIVALTLELKEENVEAIKGKVKFILENLEKKNESF